MWGTLDIDTNKRNISLKVDPRGMTLPPPQHHHHKKKRRKVSDVEAACMKRELASLSGGEKSKTMVCLIMALWEQQSPPFR